MFLNLNCKKNYVVFKYFCSVVGFVLKIKNKKRKKNGIDC